VQDRFQLKASTQRVPNSQSRVITGKAHV
jgi:hypothetical protein